MLTYLNGPESDPFNYIYSSDEWLYGYDPPRPFPFWVNLEPTNHCQLDCLFCSRQKSTRRLGFLDLDLARAIFGEMSLWPGSAVRLAGWGEPFLHPKLPSLCAMAKEAGVAVKIYTNGQKMDRRTLSALIDSEVDEIQFSFQGLNEKQYHFNRVGGRHARLAQNIELAHDLRGRRPRPFLSALTSVLADELAQASPQAFCDRWLGLVDKVAIDLTNLNFVSDLPRVQPFLPRQSEGLRRGLCVDVFLALEVKYDGTIEFCGQDANSRPEHTAGRFPALSLKEAWDGEPLAAQRDRVGRALGHESSPVCRNCYHNTNKYDLFKNLSAGPSPAGQSPAGPNPAGSNPTDPEGTNP